jgi:hypothetical protein
MSAALFPLGACVATPGAIRALSEDGRDWRSNVAPLLSRHKRGDWGDVSSEDAHENEFSIRQGLRIMSSYEVGAQRVWIITEADRSSTCILLPEEY